MYDFPVFLSGIIIMKDAPESVLVNAPCQPFAFHNAYDFAESMVKPVAVLAVTIGICTSIVSGVSAFSGDGGWGAGCCCAFAATSASA